MHAIATSLVALACFICGAYLGMYIRINNKGKQHT